MVGEVVREPLPGGSVRVLDVFDRVDQVVDLDRPGIDQHHRSPDHGVDLGPLHPVQTLQRRSERGAQVGVAVVERAPHLDMYVVPDHRHPSAAATFAVAQPTLHGADRRRERELRRSDRREADAEVSHRRWRRVR